eukprot:TRINITY_DN4484_c0_g1_i3.p3 TRINITY_DN4484_c0_g1~~TRINITY_DN4484_c0_g1_i3.p3  ORF type:complete len:111 (-),score=32.03 TRINITY_DN4484_c0_g1_i3:81-413(-)
MDRTSMFTVTTQVPSRAGDPAPSSRKEHEVKALEIIWAKFPQFSRKNTVHVDDLARNFALNPQSGIKIKAFKRGAAGPPDTQLVLLARYLKRIVAAKDLAALDHSRWDDQ